MFALTSRAAAMHTLTSQADFDAVVDEPRILVYKHSTRCPISAMAYEQVAALAQAHPDAPIYMVDVVAHRDVSRYIGERTGVEHHSPQAMLLERGRAVWTANHYDVRREELERWLTEPAGR